MDKTWALTFPALAGKVYTTATDRRENLDRGSESSEFGWPFTHGFWKETRRKIMAQLEELTLADLARFEDFRRICCEPLQAHIPAGRDLEIETYSPERKKRKGR